MSDTVRIAFDRPDGEQAEWLWLRFMPCPLCGERGVFESFDGTRTMCVKCRRSFRLAATDAAEIPAGDFEADAVGGWLANLERRATDRYAWLGYKEPPTGGGE